MCRLALNIQRHGIAGGDGRASDHCRVTMISRDNASDVGRRRTRRSLASTAGIADRNYAARENSQRSLECELAPRQ